MRILIRLLLGAGFVILGAYSVTLPYANNAIDPDVARAAGSLCMIFIIWYLIDRKLRK